MYFCQTHSFILCLPICIAVNFRLLNSFAEEQALEDAIYYLGEAIRKNVIDLDVFLKVMLFYCYYF